MKFELSEDQCRVLIMARARRLADGIDPDIGCSIYAIKRRDVELIATELVLLASGLKE